MLFCLALEGKCTGDDIFMALDKKLHELELSWDRCVGICTDGAGAMLGKKKGLKAKVHNVAPHIRFTRCIIHREALACKAIVPELKTVFDTAVKIVNYIKSRPLNARLFASLCKDMGSDHEALLLHTEIRWLSRGKVFTRLYQLRDEVRLFLLNSGSEFSVFMTDSNWLGKLVYLSCIFDKLNELNLSIQGPNTNILSLFDKINAFSKKLERWISRAEEGNIEMFPELEEFGEENELCLDNLKAMIVNHLRNLLNHFKKYFLEESDLEQHDWIRMPFTAPRNHLPSDLEEALLELSSDRTLRLKFGSTTLNEFWISVSEEYPGLSKAALNILTPIGSTYLCETTYLLCINIYQE